MALQFNHNGSAVAPRYERQSAGWWRVLRAFSCNWRSKTGLRAGFHYLQHCVLHIAERRLSWRILVSASATALTVDCWTSGDCRPWRRYIKTHSMTLFADDSALNTGIQFDIQESMDLFTKSLWWLRYHHFYQEDRSPSLTNTHSPYNEHAITVHGQRLAVAGKLFSVT